MPTAKDLLNQSVTSGPATSIKAGSTNLKTKAQKAKAAELAASKSVVVSEGAVKYRTPNTAFSMPGITFKGSYYTTSDKEEQAKLDSAVKRGLLYVEQDNRKP